MSWLGLMARRCATFPRLSSGNRSVSSLCTTLGRTLPAEACAARLAGDAESRERELREGLGAAALQYMLDHPDDWQTRSQRYLEVCRGAVELGENELLLGLVSGAEDRIGQGQALVAYGG